MTLSDPKGQSTTRTRRKKHRKASRLPQVLILGGIIFLALFVLALKDSSQPEAASSSGELPQAQLDAALKAGKPTLAFFHSNNCEQCIIMIETLDQVIPEFANSITLVDINVYDPNNEPLLHRVGLRYIPTLIFYDQHGQEQTHVGVMAADVLRERLIVLVGAQ